MNTRSKRCIFLKPFVRVTIGTLFFLTAMSGCTGREAKGDAGENNTGSPSAPVAKEETASAPDPEVRAALESAFNPLLKAADDFNATCPRMVDQDTRLDSATLISDRIFQYDYTLINHEVGSIDAEGLTGYLKPRIISNVSTNPEMKLQRDHQLTMVFYYRDRNGDFIALIAVEPDDYRE